MGEPDRFSRPAKQTTLTQGHRAGRNQESYSEGTCGKRRILFQEPFTKDCSPSGYKNKEIQLDPRRDDISSGSGGWMPSSANCTVNRGWDGIATWIAD